MQLVNAIYRRKSCRNFKKTSFSAAKLHEIEKAINSFDRLYPEVELTYRFTTKTKGLFNVFAPHYLIISGTGDPREQEAAGFLFEQLILWFDVSNIGAVWLGGSRVEVSEFNKFDIIPIAFGMPESTPCHNLEQFKRKKIYEITNDITNPVMEAVRLAPSGINLQPWFFEKIEKEIKVYKQIIKPPIGLFYKLTNIDFGIALCHYAILLNTSDKLFKFTQLSDDNSKKGYNLFGKIAI